MKNLLLAVPLLLLSGFASAQSWQDKFDGQLKVLQAIKPKDGDTRANKQWRSEATSQAVEAVANLLIEADSPFKGPKGEAESKRLKALVAIRRSENDLYKLNRDLYKSKDELPSDVTRKLNSDTAELQRATEGLAKSAILHPKYKDFATLAGLWFTKLSLDLNKLKAFDDQVKSRLTTEQASKAAKQIKPGEAGVADDGASASGGGISMAGMADPSVKSAAVAGTNAAGFRPQLKTGPMKEVPLPPASADPRDRTREFFEITNRLIAQANSAAKSVVESATPAKKKSLHWGLPTDDDAEIAAEMQAKEIAAARGRGAAAYDEDDGFDEKQRAELYGDGGGPAFSAAKVETKSKASGPPDNGTAAATPVKPGTYAVMPSKPGAAAGDPHSFAAAQARLRAEKAARDERAAAFNFQQDNWNKARANAVALAAAQTLDALNVLAARGVEYVGVAVLTNGSVVVSFSGDAGTLTRTGEAASEAGKGTKDKRAENLKKIAAIVDGIRNRLGEPTLAIHVELVGVDNVKGFDKQCCEKRLFFPFRMKMYSLGDIVEWTTYNRRLSQVIQPCADCYKNEKPMLGKKA